MSFIPYGKQCIDDDDINAVVDVLKSDWLTQGPIIQAFEDAFSKQVGSKYAITVSNGTAALHLSLLALGVGPGDEVITTPNSFLATSNAILYVGAAPVFVDIDPYTFGIDATKIEQAITEKTKAIIPVHFAGFPVDLDMIQFLAKKYNLKVVEDACHALGARYNNSLVGSCDYSDCSTFSFHPVKHIATGEGGMITTNSRKIYDQLIMLRTHGVTKDPKLLAKNSGPWYYEMQALGFNYRMTDFQAALGVSQLKKITQFVDRRREIARQYDDAFKNIDWVTEISEPSGMVSAYHLYVVQIDFETIEISRADVMNQLRDKGIGTQVHYIPIIEQPYYKDLDLGFDLSDFPVCDSYYSKALSLPMYPMMSDEDVEKVVNSILKLNL